MDQPMKFPLRYLALGDSITFGIDGTNTDWSNPLPMPEPYPQLVAKQLGFESCENRAISGATLSNFVEGLAHLVDVIPTLSLDVDVITMLAGVNDFQRSAPLGEPGSHDPATVYGALACIAEDMLKRAPQAKICLMTPMKCAFKNGLAYDEVNKSGYLLQDVREAIFYTVKKYGLYICDLFEMADYTKEYTTDPRNDGIHPTQAFMRTVVAPTVAEFLKPLL